VDNVATTSRMIVQDATRGVMNLTTGALNEHKPWSNVTTLRATDELRPDAHRPMVGALLGDRIPVHLRNADAAQIDTTDWKVKAAHRSVVETPLGDRIPVHLRNADAVQNDVTRMTVASGRSHTLSKIAIRRTGLYLKTNVTFSKVGEISGGTAESTYSKLRQLAFSGRFRKWKDSKDPHTSTGRPRR
jgi:hypothetical protein